VYIVVNKLDILPDDSVNYLKLKTWISTQIRNLDEYFKDFDNSNLFLVSSITGEGVKAFLRRFEEKALDEKKEGWNDRIYVMGNSNVGKSSFLNQVRAQSKKFSAKTYKDPFDIKINKTIKYDPNKDTKNLQGKFNQLTVSVMPGTTLKPQKVEKIANAYKFYDTPGLPIYSQVTTHIEDSNYLQHILPTKMPMQNFLEAQTGNSIWIGGLCRVDIVQSSSTIFVNPFVSRELS